MRCHALQTRTPLMRPEYALALSSHSSWSALSSVGESHNSLVLISQTAALRSLPPALRSQLRPQSVGHPATHTSVCWTSASRGGCAGGAHHPWHSSPLSLYTDIQIYRYTPNDHGSTLSVQEANLKMTRNISYRAHSNAAMG